MKSKLQCTLISMAAVCIPSAVWAVVPMQSRSGGWDTAENTHQTLSGTQAFARANAEGLWFEGNLGYSKVWKENRRGFYRIEGKADAQPEEILVNQYYGNGGGCYVADENIYVSCSYLDMMGEVFDCLMTVYDGTTYKVLYQKESSPRAMAWDMAYNPVDRKVYGCFHDVDSESGYNLGTLDYNTGEVTEICDVEVPYVALAADENGVLYGIEAATGNFCRINCTDGTKTVIKSLGLRPEYLQSATYDCAKKRIYWFSQTADTSVLYEINPVDGSMLKIADYTPALDEWMGMFTRTPMAADAAPSICTDVKLIFDGSACSGEWNFVLPSTTYAGASLTGDVEWTATIDGETVASGNDAAGTAKSVPVNVENGWHKFIVYASVAGLRGPSTVIRSFIGPDSPDAPQGVSLATNESSRTITWDAVTESANGGYIVPGEITYTVTRMPDSKVIAEGIKDTQAVDSEDIQMLERYSYSVKAVYSGKESESVLTESLVLGPSIQPPFISDYTNASETNVFEIIHPNDDGGAWSLTRNQGLMCFRYRSDVYGAPADDWLITAPIHVESGKVYEVTNQLSAPDARESIEIKAGKAPTPDAMTETLVKSFTIPYDNTASGATPYKGYLMPAETGNYYIGNHAISAPYAWCLFNFGWEISEGKDLRIAAFATSFAATAADNGEKKVVLTFVSPEKDFAGGKVSSLTKATVVNTMTGETVGTVENPEAGKKSEIVDKSPADGKNEYSLVFTNEYGDSFAQYASCFVGLDRPGAVRNPNWKVDGNDITITWDAPESVGSNGGYVDMDAVTYTVLRMPDFEYIGRKMTNNFCTETYDFTAQQQFIHYLIFGSNDAGVGAQLYTRAAPVGYPIVELPFEESFSGTQTSNNWGVTELVEYDSYYSDWQISDESYYEDYKPFDNDKGMLCMHTVSGGARDLCSPLIKLPQEQGLSLQFHYAIPDPTTSLKVKVSTDYGYSWDTVAEIEGGPAKNWTAIEVNMDAYAGKTICFAFEGSAEELSNDIVIDNIKLGKFSAVSEVSNDNGVMVNVDGNKVCVTSPDAVECHVYDISGRMLASGEAAAMKPFETELSAGIFIVEVDGKGYKVRIR